MRFSESWVEKPCYGKPLEEHLALSGRDIAFPIEACVTMLLECGMQEEVRASKRITSAAPDKPGLRSEPLVCPKALLTLKTRPTGALRALLSLSGLIQSRSFGLQTEEVESVSGLRRAGRSGVLGRPSRHRRSAL